MTCHECGEVGHIRPICLKLPPQQNSNSSRGRGRGNSRGSNSYRGNNFVPEWRRNPNYAPQQSYNWQQQQYAPASTAAPAMMGPATTWSTGNGAPQQGNPQ